jgi:hypothetical protein
VTNIKPTATGDPGQGAICECGYTYCSSVLMAMSLSPYHAVCFNRVKKFILMTFIFVNRGSME